jgi:hypothetical protein
VHDKTGINWQRAGAGPDIVSMGVPAQAFFTLKQSHLVAAREQVRRRHPRYSRTDNRDPAHSHLSPTKYNECNWMFDDRRMSVDVFL